MTGADLALIGRAIRIAAEEIERNSRLGDFANRFAWALGYVADEAERRYLWKGDGRFVEQLEACAGPGCNDFGVGAAGWLVWQSQVDPRHEMALPLCCDCADKAQHDPAFVREFEELHNLPKPLRFAKVLK